MLKTSTMLKSLSLSLLITYTIGIFQEKVFLNENGSEKRLLHTHLMSAPLYGNSTDL